MIKQTNNESWNGFWKRAPYRRSVKISWSKRRIEKLLDPFVKEGMVVLDAGCGSGYFSNYFISKKCKVYSLDYSIEALSMTRDLTCNMCSEYMQFDLLIDQFGQELNGKFDLIFSDGLFEHFDPGSQAIIMGKLKSVKKPKGLVCTFVPNKYSGWQLIRPLFMPGIYEKPFDIRGVIGLHSGLEIVRKGGINVVPFSISPDSFLGELLGMLLFCFAR
jgi:cyclopropane fatty-acyl-phospholipid synthase-like methyltransferase